MKKQSFRILPFLAAPFKLLLLVLPLAALMVCVNYRVDCSGLFQGDLTTRTIVELLLGGSNVSGFSQMDERAVTELYIQLLPEDQVPETIVLGSSRAMQISAGVTGTTLYNCGMTGADYRDAMNTFYLLDKYDKLPRRILLGVDPWLFRADALDKRADTELYEEMLSVALGRSSGYQPPEPSRAYRLCDAFVQKFTGGGSSLSSLNITDETLSALFEPAYFQGNLSYYQNSLNRAATTEDGQLIPYHAVAGAGLRANADEIKMADGTVWYSAEFRSAPAEAVLATALEQAGTFLYMTGYPALEKDQCALFEEFIRYMQSRGVEIVFFLAPYHPFLYEYVSIYDVEDHAGFFEIEPYLRSFAAREGISIVGSYNPALLGLTEEDFFDGLHVRGSGIEKFFGGFDAEGRILPGSACNGVNLRPEDAPAAE